MAISTTGVRYDLIGRDSASKAFNSAGNSAGKLEKGFGKLAKAGLAAGAVLGGALVVGLAEGAKKAVEFQTAMEKISTQAGGTQKDVAALSKSVLQLGKSTQQGPDQLADSLYHLKSIGLDNVTAMKDLKVASDLAAVGGSNLEDTTNALGGAWRSGIKGAETFGKSAASVNAILGAGNMRMQDFVEAIGTGILPSAKSFGLSLNQVGAALALMTDEGIPAVDAATRLRMSFSLLGAPSKAADKQLKTIGLTGLDLATAMRGPQGIIGAISLLKQHLDASGLSAAQESQLLSRAFGGGKSDSAILTLLNNLTVLKKKQDQVNDSMGKFPAAVAAQRKTVSAQFALIKSNLDVAAIELGDKVLPALSTVVQYITKTGLPMLGKFTAAAANLIPIDALKSRASQVAGILRSAYKSSGVDKLASLFKTPKATTAPVFHLPTAPKSGPIQPGTTAGQSKALSNALNPVKTFRTGEGLSNLQSSALASAGKANPGALMQTGESLSGKQAAALSKAAAPPSMMKRVTTALSTAIGNAVKNLDWKALGGSLGKGLDTAFGYLAGHSKQLGQDIAKAIQGIDWVNVGKAFGAIAIPTLIGFIDDLFKPLFTVDFWKKHWLDTIVAVISVVPIGKVGDAIGKVFSKVPWGDAAKAIGTALDKIPWVKTLDWAKWIGETSSSLWKEISRLAVMFGTDFKDAFVQRIPKLGDWLVLQLSLIPTRIGVLGLELKSALKDAFEKVTDAVPGISGKLIRAVLKYLTKFTFYQTGVNLIEGLYNGVVDKLTGVGKWMKSNVVDPVVNWVKSLFGVHSPSTVFASIGRDLISGLKSGVVAGIAGVGKWLHSHVISPVTGAFSGAGSWLYGKGSSVVSGLKSGIGSAAAGVGKWMSSHVVSPVRGVFSSAGSWLVSQGRSVMSGLLSGLKSGLRAVTSFLSTLKSTVSHAVSGIAKSAAGAVKGLAGKIPGFATGGLAPIGQTAWVGEKGPELMQVTSKGTRIYNNTDSMAMARLTGLQVPGYASGTVSNAQARVNAARADVERARERRVSTKAAETRLAAAKVELANAKRSTKATVADTLANGFLKTIETATTSAIASAVKSMNTKLQAAGAGSLVAGNLKTSAKLQSLANQKASVASTIATATQYASDQSSSLGDFLSLSNTPSSTISSLVTRMQTSQATASKFAAEIASLSKQGLDKNLLAQVAAAGPGSQLAALFSTATSSDIKQLNTLAASQAKLTTSFGQQMADSMYDSGAQAGKGFLSGLKAQEASLQAEMNKLAAGMVSTIKKKLGIKSPSRVFRDEIGKQIVTGTSLGIRMHTPRATAEVQRMADTMAAVRARGGSSGGSQVVQQHTENHQHATYNIYPQRADFTTHDLETVQRRSEARQRVGRPR